MPVLGAVIANDAGYYRMRNVMYINTVPQSSSVYTSSQVGDSQRPNIVMFVFVMLRLMLRKKGLCYVTKRWEPA